MSYSHYLAVIWPIRRALEAALVAGYDRDNDVTATERQVGFVTGIYADELAMHRREWGKTIIGEFAKKDDARAALKAYFGKATKGAR